MYGTDVFLAGAEVTTLHNALVDNGVRWILFSFFYLYDFEVIPQIHAIQDAHPEIEFTLDSGAYTYAMQYQHGNLMEPDEFVRTYFEYIQEHGHRWARIAEPDLDFIEGLGVSVAQVDEWREEMLISWPHLATMPTYHYTRGQEAWRRYCDDPRVRALAMGSGDLSHNGRNRMMVEYAHARGKTVHGFGCTKFKTTLRYVPYDQVDSTSVWAGQQYGTMYVFNPKGALGTFLTIRDKPSRRKWRNYFRDIGCNPDLILADTGPGAAPEIVAEVRKANVIAWRNLSERMHQLKIRRDEAMGRVRGRGFVGSQLRVPNLPMVNSRTLESAPREEPRRVVLVGERPEGPRWFPQEREGLEVGRTLLPRGANPPPSAGGIVGEDGDMREPARTREGLEMAPRSRDREGLELAELVKPRGEDVCSTREPAKPRLMGTLFKAPRRRP